MTQAFSPTKKGGDTFLFYENRQVNYNIKEALGVWGGKGPGVGEGKRWRAIYYDPPPPPILYLF
jgi:hypothetical protein